LFDVASSNAEDSLLPLLNKSASWAYEDEYRLISQEMATATNHDTIISASGVATVPADALTSIIVGCLASDKTIAAVKSIIPASGKPIRLQKAVRAPDQYALNIEAIT
jgi:hypothetical protein